MGCKQSLVTLTKESGRRNNVDEGGKEKSGGNANPCCVRVPLFPPVYIFFSGGRPHFCATHYIHSLLASLTFHRSLPHLLAAYYVAGAGRKGVHLKTRAVSAAGSSLELISRAFRDLFISGSTTIQTGASDTLVNFAFTVRPPVYDCLPKFPLQNLQWEIEAKKFFL